MESTPAESGGWARWGVILALIAVAGAVLRFYALGHQGLWYDEAQTGWMVRAPLGQMLAGVPRSESAPPLYYVVAWLWVRVFGDTREGLRSLSAVAGVLTIPVAFAAARSLVGRRAALVAALLVAVNPLLIWYSQEARAYALLVLASTVALWCFGRARERPTGGRFAAWAVAAAVAMWIHYFAVFLVVPEALLLLARPGATPRTRSLAMLGLGAAGLPLVVIAVRQGHHAAWIQTIPLSLRLEQVGRFFIDGFTPPAGPLIAVLSAVLAAIGCVLAATRGDDRRGVASVAIIAAAGIGLPLLLIAVGLDYFDGRNLLAASVPLLVVLAAGFATRRMAVLGLPAVGALAAISIGLVVVLQREPRAQRPDWPALTAALERLPSPRVVQIHGGSRSWAIPLTFELRRTWWLRPRGARVMEFDVIRKLPAAGSCGGRPWWGPACAIPVLTPLTAPPPAAFHRVAEIRAGGFAITRYRAAHPVRIYPHSPFGRPSRSPARRNKRHLLLTPMREPVIT
jgi:mannosyltransferase